MYPKYRLRRSSFCLAPLAPTLMRVFFLYEKGLLFRFSFLFVVQFFVRCRFFLTDFLSIIPWYRFFFRVWFRWSFEFPSLFLSILSFDFFSIDNFYQFFLSDFFFSVFFIFSPAPPRIVLICLSLVGLLYVRASMLSSSLDLLTHKFLSAVKYCVLPCGRA